MSVLQQAQQNKQIDYAICPMTLEDVGSVAEVEREAFPTMRPPTPFRQELSNRLARYLVAVKRADLEASGALSRRALLAGAAAPQPFLQRLTHRLSQMWRGDGAAQKPATQRPVAGYVGLWLVGDEAHVMAIATRKAVRRQGIGELLLIASIELAAKKGADVVTLEVRVSNSGAQALYEKYGFRQVGLRRRYYTDNNEDALIMSTDSVRSPQFQEHFRRLMSVHQQRWGHATRTIE
ncbi:MAG: ribosomal protein S18-alanine N-acetyltransferase [Chloroflexi bacterium]|nr:ribosomal protein S18-alanine N-acetyltransferase [Chloroflexota bacterium]